MLTTTPFGTIHGQTVHLHALENDRGTRVQITNYGGIVTSVLTADREGRLDDIVLGYDRLEDYLDNSPYFGCLVGRYANRIAHGAFTLDGREYRLACNNGDHHLHGGPGGFHQVIWRTLATVPGPEPALQLGYLSRDGEEGYPGTLKVEARFTLTRDNALRIDYQARTDRTTHVNLTHHGYFNLSGADTILDQEIAIAASRITAVDRQLIPNGALIPVDGTGYDLRHPRSIGCAIDAADNRELDNGGFDHNFVLDRPALTGPPAALARDPRSGRVVEVHTTEPGLQFYTGNFLDGTRRGKQGRIYDRHAGFCLEAQHFPDSPNQAHFPSTRLDPDMIYRQTTRYRFTTDREQ